MKRIITFLSILIAFACIVSCSSNSTPTTIANKYLSCIKSGNYDGAADLFYYDGDNKEEGKNMVKSVLNDKVKSEIEAKGGVKSYELGEETISKDETSAKVKATVTYGNGKSENMSVELKSVDDKWYVSTGK